MPFDQSTSPAMLGFASYVCSDQGADVAQAVNGHIGGGKDQVRGGGLSGAARVCTDTKIAQVVLTEIGSLSLEMACECVSEICRTGSDVIVLGEQSDINTYRALRNAGAAEYFAFPVTLDDILSVQRRPDPAPVAELPPVQHVSPKAPSIAVVGSNGGVGASLLAQNLAFYAADAEGGNLRTALIDADIRFGSQAIDLDQDETFGLFEALKSPDRIDDTFIKATMTHLNERLSLYSNQVAIGQNPQAYEAGFSMLYPPLRDAFKAVVTDLPRDVLLQDDKMAPQFDAVILVIPAGFSGVNAASRLIERMTVQTPKLRILPVMSELRKDAGLTAKDIASVLERPIAGVLPRADAAVASAHRAGKSLATMKASSPYAKAVRTIWSAAVAAPVPEKAKAKRSFLKRMLG